MPDHGLLDAVTVRTNLRTFGHAVTNPCTDVIHVAIGVDESDGSNHHPPDVTFGIEFVGMVNHMQSRVTANFGPRMTHICTLIFDLVASARWCWHTSNCDWNIVGELATQLPRLRRVVFGFVSKSNLDRFAKRWGDTALSKFINAQNLYYAYNTGWQSMKWISVHPTSLSQEGQSASLHMR